MSKFKIGDIVRVKENCGIDEFVGAVGCVTEVDSITIDGECLYSFYHTSVTETALMSDMTLEAHTDMDDVEFGDAGGML